VPWCLCRGAWDVQECESDKANAMVAHLREIISKAKKGDKYGEHYTNPQYCGVFSIIDWTSLAKPRRETMVSRTSEPWGFPPTQMSLPLYLTRASAHRQCRPLCLPDTASPSVLCWNWGRLFRGLHAGLC